MHCLQQEAELVVFWRCRELFLAKTVRGQAFEHSGWDHLLRKVQKALLDLNSSSFVGIKNQEICFMDYVEFLR